MTRTYESSGPDVKIRGTAQHVAEKYLQLARDAQSSGDPVAAENLLQHAEHYFRIIAAAQAAQTQAQLGYGRNGEELDEGDEDDDFVALPDRFASPLERAPQPPAFQPPQPVGYGGQPQPYFERPAYNAEQGERQNDRPERQDRNPERAPHFNAERQDRQPQDRQSQDRQSQDRQLQDRQSQDRQPRNDRRFNQQGDRPNGERQNGQGRNRFRDPQPRFEPSPVGQEQPRVDFDAVSAALPAFITAPPRTLAPPPRSEIEPETFVEPDAAAPAPASLAAAPADFAAPPADFVVAPAEEEGENRFHLRPRRRRRVRAEPGSEDGDSAPLPETSSVD